MSELEKPVALSGKQVNFESHQICSVYYYYKLEKSPSDWSGNLKCIYKIYKLFDTCELLQTFGTE